MLPKNIKDELKITCVLFTADVGGILTLEFIQGNLQLRVEHDVIADEIGCELKIKELREKKHELFQALQRFYHVFIENNNHTLEE